MTNESREDHYSFPEILNMLIEQFSLPNDEHFMNALRNKVKRVCAEISFTDNNGQTKNLLAIASERGKEFSKNKNITQARYIFNEVERIHLIKNPSLRKYIVKYTSDGQKAEYIINEDIAELENENDINMFANLSMDDMNNCCPLVSDEEVKMQKMEYMLEALFQKFYTPINESKLKDDMQTIICTMPMQRTAESVAALKRLCSPAGNAYYKEVEKNNASSTEKKE